MSLILKIEFPNDLRCQDLVRQCEIPCLCKVSGDSFELEFQSPLPHAVGNVEGWTLSLMNERVWGLAGGDYIYNNFAKVTLRSNGINLFFVEYLSFFYASSGWLNLIENGDWVQPRVHSQEELDELDNIFPRKKGNKKRQRLMDALKKINEDDKKGK